MDLSHKLLSQIKTDFNQILDLVSSLDTHYQYFEHVWFGLESRSAIINTMCSLSSYLRFILSTPLDTEREVRTMRIDLFNPDTPMWEVSKLKAKTSDPKGLYQQYVRIFLYLDKLVKGHFEIVFRVPSHERVSAETKSQLASHKDAALEDWNKLIGLYQKYVSLLTPQ